MPTITRQARTFADNSKVINYGNTVGTSLVTYTMETEQDEIVFHNQGTKDIDLTVNGSTTTVIPGQRFKVEDSFSSFDVQASEGEQEFEVTTRISGTSLGKLSSKVKDHTSQLAETMKVVNVVEQFGAKGDGTTDDLSALMSAKDYVLANGGIFYIPKKANCFISGDLSLFGIRNVVIEGKVSGDVSNKLTLGDSSVLGQPTDFYINDVRPLTLRVQGIMNGRVTVNMADHLMLFADGNNDQGYALAYSQFYLGRIKKLEITSVAGTKSAWMNENKFFGGRVDNLIIGGSYPHNNNIFYGTMFENFTADINNGTCNYFYDVRLEGNCSITFGTGTANNYFFRSHYNTRHAYLQGIELFGITIVNNGFDNGVVGTPDLTHRKEKIYELNPKSNNFKLENFTKNENDLTVNGSYREFYDTGLIELTNPLSLIFKSDRDLFNIFLYAYDADRNLITTEPTDFTVMSGGSWDSTNYRFHFGGALVGTGNTGVPVYPNGTVKYFRYVVRTGGTLGEIFNYAKVIKIELNNKWTHIIPLTHRTTCDSDTKPSKGTWKKGEYVRNSNPSVLGSAGSQYIINGWLRLTDGAAHVLNTDWVEDRALTGS